MTCGTRYILAARFLALLGALTGCAESSTPTADGGVEPTYVGVETVVPATVVAGTPFVVHCLLVDEQGDTHTPPDGRFGSVRIDPADSVAIVDGALVAQVAGQVAVVCGFDDVGLTDPTPATLTITPGPAVGVAAHLSTDSIVAGGSVEAFCTAVDAFGNDVEEVPSSFVVSPVDAGNAFDGATGTFEHAGMYDVSCDAPGTTTHSARLEVRPDRPASMVVSLVPGLSIYDIGQVIELAPIVEDRFGNPIDDAAIAMVSAPAQGQSVGPNRFRYFADGLYRITATVTSPTQDDLPLTQYVEVLVDSNGPTIDCGSPANAAILNVAPGASISFNGQVSDLSGVSSVRVNGTTATVNASGAFSSPITSRFGINFVDLSATDGTGRESTRTCSFLAANQWVPQTGVLADAVSLRLRQAAFDDSNRTGAINSLDDILQTVLNSSGLRTTLHNALSAANPLKPDACDNETCTFLGCVCWYRSKITYLDSRLDGPNTSTLTLVDGGLRAHVRLGNVKVQLRAEGKVGPIPFDTTGWVTIDSVDVDVIFDVALSGGRPRITVRNGSVMTSVGNISTAFDGIDGFFVNIIVAIANGTVRDMVSNLVTSYVRDNFNTILDGVVGGLDISTLGTTFNVPKLDGSGNLALAFSPSFTTLNTNTSRMLLGIGTKLTGPTAHARPTLGSPIPTGTVLVDSGAAGTTAVDVHVGVVSQALHALWRGGFFDATLNGGTVAGLPAGVSAQLTTHIPPAVEIVGNRVQLSIGAMRMRLAYPDFFPTPIDAWAGLRASMRVTLVGNDLRFDDFQLTELHFSPDGVSLDTSTQNAVNSVLSRILGKVVGSALNDALPAIPIPSFPIPSSLSSYGLPVGAQLGITSPSLATSGRHFELSGGFGIR